MSSSVQFNFQNKVVLVTGSGGSGTGAAIAISFAKSGAKVAITGRKAEPLQKVADEIEKVSGAKPLQIVGDLEDRAFTKSLLEQVIAFYSKLDILVNNAAQWSREGTLESPQLLDVFDKLMNINVRPAIQLTQLAVPYLEVTKGCVINMSSTAAHRPRNLGYCTSKAALLMATQCMALECAPKGIRVNSVDSGRILRGWGQELGERELAYNKMTVDQFSSVHALGRCATTIEIANLVLFLASDLASNMTGSNVINDGGRMLK